ncbi:MAG: protoporphyrinogen/coproporphyrinogen oxidase [Anaerolineae bacterium]
MVDNTLIVGAGMTGLAAGMVSGLPVLEAAGAPGGICSSYYMAPGDTEPSSDPAAAAGNAYRFEIGGGHWILGGDPVVLQFLEGLVEMQRYERRSSVYFPDTARYVPYPIQNNLRFLDADTAVRALEEMARPFGSVRTMEEWLVASFGQTLTERFFAPFHDLYTAGLYRSIAPQDPYKSPVDLGLAVRGALSDAPAVGYNTSFLYPKSGLDDLARRMGAACRIEYGCRVTGFDLTSRRVLLADGSSRPYDRVLSTLPLNQAMRMAGLDVDAPADPHTAVLVLNIGATRGEACPDDHWLYIPFSEAGFHRVGFYSNVDSSFLPAGLSADRVSIYVERAFPGDARCPDQEALGAYGRQVVDELVRWGFIGEAEVVHPTWIDVAYTWSWPGSAWQRQALAALEEVGIYQVGRYGRWVFQGIADSIRDGFVAGAALKAWI